MDFLSPWPCVSCVGFIPVREEAQDAHPGRASRRPGGRWALPTRGTLRQGMDLGKKTGTMGKSSENHGKMRRFH